MIITSRSNRLITDTAALKEKKYRDADSLFMAEGEKLFLECIDSGADIERVFCTSAKADICRNAGVPDEKLFEVTDEVLLKLSTEKAPQGIICIAKYIDKIHNINKIYIKEDFLSAAPQKYLLLSSLRDPGNLGTIIRTSVAFGINELILSPDCADIYNPKTIRASMGAVFRQKISFCRNLADTVVTMRESGYTVLAAMLDENASRLGSADIQPKTAFIIGNEGHGISDDVLSAASGKVYIPMEKGAESLNAAVAASIFMWQMYRNGQ